MKLRDRLTGSTARTLIALTFVLSGTFKLASFARETFIAARFGLSPVTDAYFSLQQMPLILAAFMFGPFCRAFAPAYADSRLESRRVEWLAGVVVYGSLLGLILTAGSLAFAPMILKLFTRSEYSQSWATLAVISLCYWPIVQIGLFSGVAISYGRNLSALTMTGLPYLLMTTALVALYLAGHLNALSLPLSMTLGFLLAGVPSIIAVVWRERPIAFRSYAIRPWRLPRFRVFAGQLAASSLENVGFSTNQMLILFCMARAGTGAISANNCASRIGLLGYSLLVQPLVQLLQGRLCTTEGGARKKTFRSYLLAMLVGTLSFATLVFLFRSQVAALIYMHGKVSAAALAQVIHLLPAWLSYFVVMSLNSMVGQYLFRSTRGRLFTRNMLCGYALANVIRFSVAGMGAPWIIWCSVIGDGSALIANLLASADAWKPSLEAAAVLEGQEA